MKSRSDQLVPALPLPEPEEVLEAPPEKEEEEEGFFLTEAQKQQDKQKPEEREVPVNPVEVIDQIFDEDFGRVKMEKFKKKCRRVLQSEEVGYEMPINIFECYKQLKVMIGRPQTVVGGRKNQQVEMTESKQRQRRIKAVEAK